MIKLGKSSGSIALMNSLFRHQAIPMLPSVAYGYVDDSPKQHGLFLSA
jgi:hypothetical protein